MMNMIIFEMDITYYALLIKILLGYGDHSFGVQ